MHKYLFLFALLLAMGAGCTATTNVETTPDVTTNNSSAVSAADEGDREDVSSTDTAEENDAAVVSIDVSASGDVKVTPVVDDAADEESTSVKEFTVKGDNFTFAPSSITVKKGDTVRITFINAEGFHDWKLDEFNVATQKIGVGAKEVVEFVADKAGSFEYYCSVGSHRQMGMKGTLIVE